MKIHTSRFGTIEVDEELCLTFASGVIGFPESTRYVILEHDRPGPFQWMQSVDNPELAFVVADPADFAQEYLVTVRAEELVDLGPSTDGDLALFVILTLRSSDPGDITANLRGPIVANPHTRQAKQLVLSDELPTRSAVRWHAAWQPAQTVPQLVVPAHAP
jgi:flagellar assembly factor FliW